MAREFDGSTDRIDYGNVLDWSGQAQTFALWVYHDTDTRFQYFNTDHVSGDASREGITYGMDDNDHLVAIGRFDGGDLTRTSSAATFPDNVWQHVLITWDGSITAANVHTYVDGSETGYATTTNGSGNPVASDGSLSLGGRIFDDAVNFNGRMAAVGRWNRVLDSGEIAILATVYSPLFIPKGLIFAPDLIRGINEPISGKTGILDGTSVIAHPRIIHPYNRPNIYKTAAAVAAGQAFRLRAIEKY